MIRSAHAIISFILIGSVSAQEICNNGVDDDSDGLVDLNDVEDCPCTGSLGGETVISLFSNPSFELLVPGCCPMGYSELHCAESWEQATIGTSDLINTCGFFPSFVPAPLPDGEGCAGTVFIDETHEYVGGCLLSTMNAGETYTLRVQVAATHMDFVTEDTLSPLDLPVTELVLYGSASCPTFPLNTNECPIGIDDWEVIATIPYQPVSEWQQVEVTFTPAFNVMAVMLGSPCTLPPEYTMVDGLYAPYVFWDDLVMNSSYLFNPALSVSGSICSGDLLLQSFPNTPSGSYQWFSEGVALIGETDTMLEVSAIDLGAGTYQFQVIEGATCSLASITIPPVRPEYPVAIVSDTVGCVPLEVRFVNASLSAVDSCMWGFGGTSMVNGCDVTHTFSVPGFYDVTLVIVTPDGCSFDSTYTALIHAVPAPTAEFAYSPQPLVLGTTNVNMLATGSGDVVAWNWTFGDLPPFTSTLQEPLVDVPQEPGAYPVELTVTNAYGCQDTVQGRLLVVAEVLLDVPNVFSPNGDGVNDHFTPLLVTNSPTNWRVYNRWGQEVYNASSLVPGWNGKMNGLEAPEGTYYWIVERNENADPGRTMTGHVTLVR